jgi:hypothetical protein
MQRYLVALVTGLLLLLCAGAGSAMADGLQAAEQGAGSQQSATSSATSTQKAPTNQNISVRIGSPGSAGSVTQTNSSAADSTASNANTTSQNATQTGGAGGAMALAQKALNGQGASSTATSTQDHPSNSNISVRIGSPGDDGKVEQTNSSAATSAATNANTTNQTATQSGAGGCCSKGGGVQAAEQVAKNEQDASSEATSTQVHPSNSNISVRIGSPGSSGSVSQSNSSKADSTAENTNSTTQNARQSERGDCGCYGHGGTQALEQKAINGQWADSSADSKQIKPSNENTSVRIHSPGNDGKVDQSNSSYADSTAANHNATTQTAAQSQGGGAGEQAAEQVAFSEQGARSQGTSEQIHPTNVNTPVRIGSPGASGDVKQANDSSATSRATNDNRTTQSADQTQLGCGCKPEDGKGEHKDGYGGGGSGGIQALGQFAGNRQEAESSATSKQIGAKNVNAPVSIGGDHGRKDCGCDAKPEPKMAPGGGSVDQSNSSTADSTAENTNSTTQDATQTASGGGAIQALDQEAYNGQGAGSEATSEQTWAKNANLPVHVGSPGSSGDVKQSNDSEATSSASNDNTTDQTADQRQHGRCGCQGTAIQALGQFSKSWQGADSSATSKQIGAKNVNAPVSIGGDHGRKDCGCDAKPEPKMAPGGGSVDQSNSSTADSTAENTNATTQDATQTMGGGCGCEPRKKDGGYGGAGLGLQAAGQFAYNGQEASSEATSEQWWPSNANVPVALFSGGGGGSVTQSNDSDATSDGSNGNRLSQMLRQLQ